MTTRVFLFRVFGAGSILRRPRLQIGTGLLVDASNSLTLPRSSGLMTLTLTLSPSLQMSVVFSVRPFCSSEIWTRPSLAPRKLTKAPKSTVFTTVVIDHAKLRLGDDVLDPSHGGLAGRTGHGGHLDGAVIIDVDLRAGGLADLADDLAARPMMSRILSTQILRVVIFGALSTKPCGPVRPSPSRQGCAAPVLRLFSAIFMISA